VSACAHRRARGKIRRRTKDIIQLYSVKHSAVMEECVAVPPTAAVERSRRPNLELRIRLPAPLLVCGVEGPRLIVRAGRIPSLPTGRFLFR
jgi:hypothetical protein